jgi:ribonuclease kappa
MLGLLGVFFFIKTPILSEDLPIDDTEWEKQGYQYKYIEDLYKQNAYNCWIAAGLYCVTFVISVVMIKVNQRSSYSSS